VDVGNHPFQQKRATNHTEEVSKQKYEEPFTSYQ